MKTSVTNICTVIQKILVKSTKYNLAHGNFDSFQALHIMKQVKSYQTKDQEKKKKNRTFLESRTKVIINPNSSFLPKKDPTYNSRKNPAIKTRIPRLF